MLARRLARRGVTVSGGAVAAVLGECPMGVAAPLVTSTSRAATLDSTGQAVSSGLISARVALLTEGVLKAMLLSKLTRMTALLVLVGCLAFGAGMLRHHTALGQERRGGQAGTTLTPETLARLGVRTTEATPRGGKRIGLRQVGVLTYDNDRIHSVRSRLPGEVIEIAEVKEGGMSRPLRFGDKVKKGQLLAVVWSKELGDRKAAYVDAVGKMYVSTADLDRMRRLVKEGAAAEAVLKRAEQEARADENAVLSAQRTLMLWKFSEEEINALTQEAERNYKFQVKRDAAKEAARWARMEVRAPADGTVVEKNTNVGDIVDSGTSLFKVADLSRLGVAVSIPAAELDALKGLPPNRRRWVLQIEGSASIEGRFEISQSAGRPDAVLMGHVDNAAGKLVVGQFVTAVIPPPGQDADKPASTVQEVTVPASALVEQAGATFVVVQPDARKPVFEERRVVVVRRGSDVVHIRSRLSVEQERQGFQIVRPGEQVVTAGAIELKAVLDDLKSK
jgi:cobalt-zinc-cadmium efflux system membrane fusion protein